MAKKSNTVARIDVLIGGADKARKKLEEMKTDAAALREELEKARATMDQYADVTGDNAAASYDKAKQKVAELEAQLKTTNKSIRDTQNNIRLVGEYLDNASGESLRHLNDAQRALKQLLLSVKPDDTGDLQKVQDALKTVADEISRRKGSLVEYEDIMERLSTVSDRSLGMVKTRLTELISTTERGSKELEVYQKQLQKVQEESQRRKTERVSTLGRDLGDLSENELKEYISLTKDLRANIEYGSLEWEAMGTSIEKAEKVLSYFNEQSKKLTMKQQLQGVATISENALESQRKFWEEQVKNAQQGSASMQEYRKHLQAVIDEQQKRKAGEAGRVMSNLDGSSVKEIQDAIKATTELRDAQSRGSLQWETYNKQIEDAASYLKRYDEQAKQASIEARMRQLGQASQSGLEEARKYWQGMAEQAANGSRELQTYMDMLGKVQEEELRRKQTRATEIGGNLTGSSESELREYIALNKELQQNVEAGSKEWETYVLNIQKAEEMLKRYNDSVKESTMEKQLQNVSSLSKSALEAQKKFWQAQVDGAEQGSAAMQQYQSNLDAVLTEENRRIAELGEQAIQAGVKMAQGQFKGSLQDIQRMKKALEDYKKTIDVTDTDSLVRINYALKAITEQEQKASGGMVNIQRVLAGLKTASLEDLKKAAAQLQGELEGMVRGTKEYIQASANLRQINGEIESVTKSWKQHDGAVVAVIKRLTAYVAVYGSFNFVLGKLREIAGANLQLSDSMADIQKTTGLTADEVAELGRSIDKIDTRTAQNDLYQLAATAGQVGLRSQEDILGFVKASNMLTVSLDELGSDGTASLMKLAQLTGDIREMGVEQSLNAIGSSINELSAASSATAGPIVDFMNRFGGIASQAHITSAEMAAVGATADAIGQSMEVAGTSMNKFVSTLLSNTDGVAYALNMDAKALRELTESGRTMDAIIAVLRQMEGMGGLGQLAPLMGDLGSEGARMNQLFSALAKNVGFLEEQVNLSRKAFAEGTSIMDEYNVKNNNAIAILERMGNTIREMFVNSTFVNWLKSVLVVMNDFVNWMARGEAGARTLQAALVALGTSLLAASLRLDSFVKALFRAETYTINLRKAWVALSSALKANFVSLAVGAFTSLAYWIYQTATHVSELTKETARYHDQLDREIIKINALFSALQNTNTQESERRDLIKSINEQYGKYIGFQLDDLDSTEKLAKAKQLLVAEMKKQRAAQFRESLEQNVNQRYSEETTEAIAKLQKQLQGTQGIGSELAPQAMSIVSDIVNRNIEKPIDELTAAIEKALREKFDLNRWYKGQSEMEDIKEYAADFIKLRKDYMQEVDGITAYAESQLKAANREVVDATRDMLNEMTAEYDRLKSTDVSALDEQAQKSHYARMLDLAQDYVSAAKAKMQNLSEEEKKQLQDVVDIYGKQIEELESKFPDEDAWGKGLNMKGWKEAIAHLEDEIPSQAAIDNLVGVYKQLEKETQKISDVGKYNEMFGTSFDSLEQVMQDSYNKAAQIREKLKSWNRNTSGGFLWSGSGSGSGRGQQKKMKDGMTAALARLEEYFVRRETEIKESRAKEETTEEEMNRRLERNEAEHLAARIKLRRDFLGEADGLTEAEKKQYGLEERNLEQLSKFLLDKGQAMRDGIRLKLAEDELKMQQDLLKHQAAIRKIILENDYTGQVEREWMDAIDKLELYFGESERRTEQDGQRRMTYLRQLARESYTIDAEGLEERIALLEEFSEWRKGRTQEDYDALLIMLRKYNDDYEAAENRSAERQKRIADKKWEKSGQQDAWNRVTKDAESDVTLYQTAQGLDLASDSQVEDAQLKLYRLKVQASQAYLDQLTRETQAVVDSAKAQYEAQRMVYTLKENRGSATEEDRQKMLEAESAYQQALRSQELVTLEARTKVMEQMKELEDQETSIQKRKLETLKGYTDAVVEFSGQMGEAAFGEVSDRKEAAKQLLQTTMQLTKNLIMQKVQEVVTKKALGQMEAANEQTTQAQVTAIKGSSDIASMSSTIAVAQADTTAGIASGAAKTIGKLGWWGIPLIAVISAALNALMGMAMSAFSKSKQEVAAATGVTSKGRVAAGMLTYAEGHYPVLGNDGEVYDAKYEKRLETGVYRGGPRFAIFSEKKPEMVIDGDTTRHIMLNEPEIYTRIMQISKHRIRRQALPAYADGYYPDMPASAGTQPGTQTGTQADEVRQLIAANNAVMQQLIARLEQPITAQAVIDPYGSKGAVNQLNKASRFMTKRGLTK